jgi:threonine dehydrogenase-like Zn-dependent dehydrogenase
MNRLMQHIQAGDIDPGFVITHRLKIDSAAEGYRTFRYDPDECVKVVMNPS